MMALTLARMALLLALVVVLLGGWTRLNSAGLGCPDWPGCYGTWVLPEDHTELLQGYPDAEIDMGKGWTEMVHRYAASGLGVIVIFLALIAVRHREKPGYPLRLSVLLLILVIVQGVFGMLTVTLKLLPIIVTLHLMGGLTTLTLLVLLERRIRSVSTSSDGTLFAYSGTRVLLFCVFLQLFLGGWTSTNYAGWACKDWFSCHGDERIEYDFYTGFNPLMKIGPNYEGGLLDASSRAAIQVTHRLGAVLLLTVSLWVAISLWARRNLRLHIVVYLGALSGQIILGVANVIWLLPLGLAVAHHVGAVLLLLLALNLHDRAGRSVREVTHECHIAY